MLLPVQIRAQEEALTNTPSDTHASAAHTSPAKVTPSELDTREAETGASNTTAEPPDSASAPTASTDSGEVDIDATQLGLENNLTAPQSGKRLLSNYLDEIQRIETEYGAYSNQLSEQLSGLGKAYQEMGRHREAIEVFKRAAHVSRINGGLFSLNQVPIIDDMTTSYIQRGDWSEASNNKQYLLWLYQNNYDDDDPRMLPVMNSLSNWLLSFHAMHFNWETIHLVSLADDMFKNSLKIISDNYGEDDLRSADALHGLVLTSWYLRNMYSMNTLQPGYQVEFSNTNASQYENDPKRRRLDTKYLRSEKNGKAAISQLIHLYANNPEAPPGAEAQAMVEMGDWDLLFGDSTSAIASYRQAHRKLVEDEREEVRTQAEKIFGRPVSLPDLPLLDSAAGVEQEEQTVTGYVVAQFDVTQLGDVRRVRILESMPENDIGKRKRIKTSLTNAKFRPRFVDGEPVYTEHMIYRYVFND